MSLMESPPARPITAVAWSSNTSTCPRDFTLISIAEDGAPANFSRGIMKSSYFLCYSKETSGGLVVCDIQVISDKEPLPHGYCYIPEHMEPKASVFKKKRVCVYLVPLASVHTAVLDLRLTAKSRMMLQHYTCAGDMNGYVLWCKKGPFRIPAPQAKPRSLSLDVRQLSLDPPALPLRPSNAPPLPPGKISRRRGTLQSDASVEKDGDSGHIYGYTAIDGVPFSLHPRFETQTGNMNSTNTQLTNIRIKSVQDIENEYNYPFTVEETTARRTHPSLSTGSTS
ncbi:multivesicular body subunit 12A [Hypomesus transpacificus]|uniref:multivesicular body subunit 12A n=1 Tax=Hypomesus transpacificus TaxID=137520 RepID=UPI001F075D65|nr:multivesicular body subunit 12A [Hypomesus transpacificus]